MTAPLISVQHIHKWYAGVHSLKGVTLDVQPREVIGLVGDNGAGKSTLIKILSGVLQPDKGEIRIEGQRVEITSPRSPRASASKRSIRTRRWRRQCRLPETSSSAASRCAWVSAASA